MSDTPSDRKPVTDIIYFDFDDEELDAAADAEVAPYEDLSQGDTYDDYDDDLAAESDTASFGAQIPRSDAQLSDGTQFPGTGAISDSTLRNDGTDTSLYIENLENDAREDAEKQRQEKKRSKAASAAAGSSRSKRPRNDKNREDDLTHPDYTVTITKGLTNTVVKRHYFSYARYHLLRIFMFLLFLAFITYIAYSFTSMATAFVTRQGLINQINDLKKENSDLSSQLAIAEAKNTQLSQAMNATIANSQSEAAKYEDSLLPNGFPLSRFAPMEITFEGADNVSTVATAGTTEDTGDGTEEDTEDPNTAVSDDAVDENTDDIGTEQSDDNTTDTATAIEDAPSGNPIALFTCSDPTSIIASGGGVVTRITSDELFGTMLTIDHRNGYITIYRHNGEALVSVGDTIERGDTLFEITEENTGFGYQIKLNDSFINPASMIEING